jgi:hypothetical protein
MTAKVFSQVRSFPNNAALAQGTVVKMSGGFLAAAGATDRAIGVMENRSFATDPVGSVRMFMDTARHIAAGAVTQYADVYQAASGQLGTTVAGAPYGMALEAASGANSLFEVLPYRQSVLTPLAVTGGIKIARGQTSVTGTQTVVTGLTTVVAVVASLDSDPTTDPEIAAATIGDQAGTPAAGSIILKTWKTLGGTPAAGTAAKNVNWIAIGT